MFSVELFVVFLYCPLCLSYNNTAYGTVDIEMSHVIVKYAFSIAMYPHMLGQ